MALRFAVCLIVIAACSHVALAQLSMLHQSGRNIVNASGQTVVLKGMNLGGFMVMEPWMCPADSGGLPDTYSIIQELDNRFGVAEEQTLMRDYQQAWITTQDFVNMKNAGFNVIRVPVWWGNFYPIANVSNSGWRSDAFTELDWVISQAAAQGIYTIVDMHGVVGGESTSDDTGQENQNQYWTNSNDQGNTAYMMWEIANHYNGNPNVAGYDLINEPMNAPSDSAVISAYASLYTTVRSADASHIVIIEGTFDQWDWAMLPNPSSEGWSNVVYEMHEYQWNTTQAAVNAGAVNEVNEFNNYSSYNTPDYIGEWNDMGYNSSYQYSYNLWNSNGISSTMWALKNSSPGSGWGMYTPSWTPPIPNVSTDSAATIAADWAQWTTANAFTLNTALGFTVNSGGGGTTTEGPYGGVDAAIPGTVMAENYDTGGQGVGYSVTSTNGSANSYRSDGVDLEAATSPATGDDLGWSASGQWFRYTVNASTAGTYTVSFLVASESAITDAFHLSNSSGTNLTGSVAVPDTGGWQTWETVTATVTLPAGVQTLTLNQDNGGWNIDSMDFVSSAPTCTTKPNAPTGLAASGTSSTGTTLSWTADTAPANCSISSYTVLKSGASIGTATGTSFAVTGLSASTTYSFTVEATDAAGTSAASSALSVTTSASGSGGGGATFATGTPLNIINENSGLCVGASGQGTANGTVLQMYTCANGTYSTQLSQEWIFTAASSGYYEVADANATTEAWNVVNVGTTNGSLMQIWTYGAASNEEFSAVSLGSGYYKFVGQGSGLCLDVPANSKTVGTQLDIYTCNGTTAQAFKFVTP
jgi:aryl-phospho-beta-D-glucosidase BglC (GH1 family)